MNKKKVIFGVILVLFLVAVICVASVEGLFAFFVGFISKCIVDTIYGKSTTDEESETFDESLEETSETGTEENGTEN